MWDDATIVSFRKTLLDWYDSHKRDLPWRKTKDPYAIWVSEIMLQQTQVATVIPYYERFLTWFPKIEDLAKAPEEKLLKAWEGLGYYSRVRNMQAAAQQIVRDFDGRFPNQHADILRLKGIGPYTAGAIASIAFDLPEPAVDGNVMRVMARLFEVDYDIGDPKNRKIFQALMAILIDPDRPGDFNQALMDLGADVESAKNPRPHLSPIKAFNAAYLHDSYDRYPIKLPKKKPRPLSWLALLVQNKEGAFLLEKNENRGLLSGFWTFPLLEMPSQAPDDATICQLFKANYPCQIRLTKRTFGMVTHTFSHQKWTVCLREAQLLEEQAELPDKLKWVFPQDFANFPMATPQKKMWQAYQTKANKD
nr:A/G-specific adenine glycosylase [Streptococcus sp. DD12]